MIKIDYVITTQEPLHHGGSDKFGTLTPFNREKVTLPNPVSVKTKFGKGDSQQKLKRQALSLILIQLWNRMDNKSRVTIYDEIASKLLASSSAQTKFQFLNLMCQKLGVRSITQKDDGQSLDVVDLLDLFSDEELLQLIRDEHQFIIATFRKLKDENILFKQATKDPAQAKKAKAKMQSLFGSPQKFDEETGFIDPIATIESELHEIILNPANEELCKKHFDTIPYVSGNGIRGLLRRLVMRDFCNLAGVTEVNPNMYHQLFTGGNISESTGIENLEQRAELINMCPMIGLFGSAIGSQTIQGNLIVGGAYPLCKERGTGEQSYHEILDILFATRLDSSKQEESIKILYDEEKTANQMKYEYEVIVQGAKLSHLFICKSEKELLQSAFWRMLILFKENPYICAKSSIGHGRLDLSDIDIPEKADKLYLKHIEENKEKIVAYISSKKDKKKVKDETKK